MQSGENLGIYMKQPKSNEISLDVKETQKLRSKIQKSPKIKITINIDETILSAVKLQASKTGIPYQKLVNRLLAESLNRRSNESDRIDKIEEEIKKMKKQISA